jgi:prepilin-type processing-associated H-X9-DG protein
VASLGKIGDSFTVLMADGSVQQLKATINAAMLLNLFQRNDGNVINIE